MLSPRAVPTSTTSTTHKNTRHCLIILLLTSVKASTFGQQSSGRRQGVSGGFWASQRASVSWHASWTISTCLPCPMFSFELPTCLPRSAYLPQSTYLPPISNIYLPATHKIQQYIMPLMMGWVGGAILTAPWYWQDWIEVQRSIICQMCDISSNWTCTKDHPPSGGIEAPLFLINNKIVLIKNEMGDFVSLQI